MLFPLPTILISHFSALYQFNGRSGHHDNVAPCNLGDQGLHHGNITSPGIMDKVAYIDSIQNTLVGISCIGHPFSFLFLIRMWHEGNILCFTRTDTKQAIHIDSGWIITWTNLVLDGPFQLIRNFKKTYRFR